VVSNKLNIYQEPKLVNPRLLLGFSGWMDGGEVSTGTVKYLVEKLGAEKFAQIEPEGFYIYNFPSSMEISALFRPYAKIESGIIQSYEDPGNIFFCDPRNNLILFSGKEPNLAWQEYVDCIIFLCERFNVGEIYFIGSVAGLTPHTREPRIFCSASQEKLKAPLEEHGIKFTSYEGPASIVTYMMVRASQKGLNMVSLVAEIPAYVQGYNPICIETAAKCVASLCGLHIQLDDLRSMADEFEKKLNQLIQQQPQLEVKIRKLEEDYDEEIFDTEMGDLKQWLEQQGIRVD
jgi:proteasome assembly chaperone (PAC2) family protein